ncbi:uncharacterized protein K452DRAFT_303138 [Aplosporella prunicola CBS 121167]|uniref:Carbohydrate-binding module family 50 protein n=1 Tax=Aplosporella prunicola CBS 121167 TaxID=1176127 RepID=A0A6A6AVL0_9PEZI|nr:uncharacterized protein K452DRAFT_303138 [Aplosporella prunicola CBS 121167]KAF2135979.1 hypothetical protein K452DRAFT_303138 [Aplosporella prunicola CBS 121167]
MSRRWNQHDGDSNRLPEGMVCTGYDADTQKYHYRDRDGQGWESQSGNRYGPLKRVTPLAWNGGPLLRHTVTPTTSSSHRASARNNNGHGPRGARPLPPRSFADILGEERKAGGSPDRRESDASAGTRMSGSTLSSGASVRSGSSWTSSIRSPLSNLKNLFRKRPAPVHSPSSHSHPNPHRGINAHPNPSRRGPRSLSSVSTYVDDTADDDATPVLKKEFL